MEASFLWALVGKALGIHAGHALMGLLGAALRTVIPVPKFVDLRTGMSWTSMVGLTLSPADPRIFSTLITLYLVYVDVRVSLLKGRTLDPQDGAIRGQHRRSER
jgi:hypothetical protein